MIYAEREPLTRRMLGWLFILLLILLPERDDD